MAPTTSAQTISGLSAQTCASNFDTGQPTARLNPRRNSTSPRGRVSHLQELCNGWGTCRQTDSGTMCPTYQASKEEIQATRGRTNLLRAAISGELPEVELYSERFQEEVLDLCIGCKGSRMTVRQVWTWRSSRRKSNTGTTSAKARACVNVYSRMSTPPSGPTVPLHRFPTGR